MTEPARTEHDLLEVILRSTARKLLDGTILSESSLNKQRRIMARHFGLEENMLENFKQKINDINRDELMQVVERQQQAPAKRRRLGNEEPGIAPGLWQTDDTDAVITCQGKQFPVHRAVVSAASPVFKVALASKTSDALSLARKSPTASPLEHLICPISHELPVDPVWAEDGNIYERKCILLHLSHKLTSPVNNTPMGPRLTAARNITNMLESMGDEGRQDELLTTWLKAHADRSETLPCGTQTYQIPDLLPDVAEAMLRFIYAGSCPLCDDDDASETMLLRLLDVSARYEITALTRQVARVLSEGFTVHNIAGRTRALKLHYNNEPVQAAWRKLVAACDIPCLREVAMLA